MRYFLTSWLHSHSRRVSSLVKTEVLSREWLKNGAVKRITELEEYLNGFDHILAEYDEQFVRAYIEKIIVYENRFEIEFKAEFE